MLQTNKTSAIVIECLIFIVQHMLHIYSQHCISGFLFKSTFWARPAAAPFQYQVKEANAELDFYISRSSTARRRIKKSTFLFTPADFPTTQCGQCVLSALGLLHILYARPYTPLLVTTVPLWH